MAGAGGDEGDRGTGRPPVVVREAGLRIRFCGDVCPASAAAFQRCLSQAATESLLATVPGEADGPPVIVFLQSDGGDVFSGLACMDAVEASPARVVVVAEGMVASAATFILVGAHRRIARPSCNFMVHQVSTRIPSGGPPLGLEDLQDEVANSRSVGERVARVYVDRTHMTHEHVGELMRHERYMDAEQALENGLVHTISRRG